MNTTQIDKKELKHWIDELDDDIILLLLQSLREAKSLKDWFWDDISAQQKRHIIDALKKAKESNSFTQQQLWKEIEFQYAPENQPDPEIERLQLQEVKKRIAQYEKDGKSIPGEQVHREIEKRLSQ